MNPRLSVHRGVVIAILLVAFASAILFLRIGGISVHAHYEGDVAAPTQRPEGFHLIPGFDGTRQELTFKGVSCHAHAAWSNDLYGVCH